MNLLLDTNVFERLTIITHDKRLSLYDVNIIET